MKRISSPRLSFLVAVVFGLASGSSAYAQYPFRMPSPAFPSTVRPLAAFDADADGDQDLFTANGLYLNDGSGRFTAATGAVPSFALAAKFARAADMDADGDLDLIVVNSALSVHYNGGTGVFGVSVVPASSGGYGAPPPTYDSDLVVGDFDGDGLLDIAGPGGGFKVHLQSPPGVFTDATATLSTVIPAGGTPTLLTGGDLDGDGKFELLLDVAQSSVLLRHVGGAFVASVVAGGSIGAPHSAAAGDFDGDGRTDFVVSRTDFSVGPLDEFIRQPGGAVFAILHARPYVARLGAIDVGGDGRDDVLRSKWSGAVVIDYLTGASLPAPPLVDDLPNAVGQGFPLGSGRGFVVFDADGDGDDDVAGPVDVGDYGLALGTSSGSFVVVSGGAPSAAASAQTVFADFDGDGDPDLARAVAAGGASSLEYRSNDGRGRFTAPVVSGLPVPSTSGIASRFVVGDFDQDGFVDALQLTTSQPPVVHRQTAPGVFAATTVGAGPVFAVAAAAAADVDADGDLDVTFAGTAAPGLLIMTSGVFVLFNTGGVLSPPSLLSPSTAFLFAAPIQADSDGVPDYALSIAVSTPAPPSYQFVVVSGATGATLATPGSITSGVGVTANVAVGDLNGDGADDVIADGVAWLGGAANFAATISPFPLFGNSTGRRYVSDLDGDGTVDLLIVGNPLSQVAFGTPGGGFGAPANLPLYSGPAVEVLADFDRDGDVDLVDRTGRIWTYVSAALSPGTPAFLGRTGSFEVQGPAGAPFELFASTTVFTQTPVAIPNYGNLWLDPNTVVYIGPGVSAANGPTLISVAVPNLPALAGLTLWWQSVLPAQTRLSNVLATPIYAP